MQVVFKNDWYYGEGRYRKTSTPQEVPDHLIDRLPKTAKIVAMVSEDIKESVEKAPSLSDFDEERKASDAYGQIVKDANRQADQFNLVSEAAYKLIDEHNLDTSKIVGTGKDGRITKFDVEDYLSQP